MEMLGVDVPVYLLLTVAAVILSYIYTTWNHSFFKKRGIRGPDPYPFVGNTLGRGLMQSFDQWTKTYGKVYGIYVGREPTFVISDLDVLKDIFVKKFNEFQNRRVLPLVAYPLSLGVFFLEDAAWKRVRNIITPTFSGVKLRAMCPDINDCSRTLANNFSKTANTGKTVNMKEYFGAYSMDVIARTVFGVKVDSQNDFNDPFISHVRKIFTPSPLMKPLFILAGLFPCLLPILKALGLSSFPKYIMDFFVRNTTAMIKERQLDSKEVSEKRTDFLQLLMDAEIPGDPDSDEVKTNGPVSDKQSVRRLTTDEIVGQGVLFFIAGYETTASTLNFVSYMLATHPDVQEGVYQEIRDVLKNEEPNYDNISKMKYLENVINETLRVYPPFTLHRKATETVTIKGITIPKGFTVFIPTLCVQRDPELFEDPDEFKPERFDEKVNPLTFFPFGYGPRICIGMRLAQVEVKIALIHILRRMKLERGPDTPAYEGHSVKIAWKRVPTTPVYNATVTLRPSKDRGKAHQVREFEHTPANRTEHVKTVIEMLISKTRLKQIRFLSDCHTYSY